MKYIICFAVVLTAVVLSGCANTAGVANLEREIHRNQLTKVAGSNPGAPVQYEARTLRTVRENVDYAANLADSYYELAKNPAAVQDAVALGLIGAATAGVAVVTFDGDLDTLRGLGLGAGAVTATSSYLRPAESSAAFLIAAERMACIAEVGELANARLGSASNNQPDVVESFQSGIRQVRLNLRRELSRTPPDYSTLFNQINNSIVTAVSSQSSPASAEEKAAIAAINQNLLKCSALTI